MPIKSALRTFIVENFLYGQDDGTLGDDVSFLENGIIDSTGVLELVSFTQESFDLQITDDELVPDNFDSLNRLERFIRSKQARKSSETYDDAMRPYLFREVRHAAYTFGAERFAGA